MTKVQEMQARLAELNQEAQAKLDEKKIDDAKALLEEIKVLKDAISMQEMLDKEEKVEVVNAVPVQPKSAMVQFGDNIKTGFKNAAETMTIGTDANGGYTVPEDVQTAIIQRREAKASLLDYVSVESVSTNTGTRTYKTRSTLAGFGSVTEGGLIPQQEQPTFETVNYTVQKYAGWLPVTNELLADSSANIANVVVDWIADESRVTANKLILAQIGTSTAVEIAGIDSIKKALNVTLGSAFKSSSIIITNDDGLQYLDTLKDSDGRYLLQPNPADPMQLRLCAGATAVPVVVIPNADLPTTGTGATSTPYKYPMLIGDFKEGIRYFERNATQIKVSDTAVAGSLNAYANDMTLFRAIIRAAVAVTDNKAFVNGFIKVASGS